MSDVVIRGMELPSNCYDCPCVDAEFDECAAKEHLSLPKDEQGCTTGSIPSWCPLIDLPRWIPCTERLPENETKYYLVTVANHGLFFTTTLTDSVEIVRWDYDRRKGRDSWHWCTERTVIAWMPLPEPYQEG